MINAEEGEIEEEGNAYGTRLVQLLVVCSEAVSCRESHMPQQKLDKSHSINIPFFTSTFLSIDHCLCCCLFNSLSCQIALRISPYPISEIKLNRNAIQAAN
uniref:Uncharacterized protein n=1 Tax=Populus trichocarpa TaxID=3694 RepID=B9I4H8_POPTR